MSNDSITGTIVQVSYEAGDGPGTYRVGDEDPESHNDAVVEKIRPAIPMGSGVVVTFSDHTHRMIPMGRLYAIDLEPTS